MRLIKIATEEGYAIPYVDNIYGSGFIAPEGVAYPCEQRHGDWIVEYNDFLKKEGYDVKVPKYILSGNKVMSGSDSDGLRDELVRLGWIHVFSPDLLSVWKYTPKIKKQIKEAFSSGQIDSLNIDSEEGIRIIEQSTSKTYSLNLDENAEPERNKWARKASREINSHMTGWVKPNGKILDAWEYGHQAEHHDILEDENYKPSKEAKNYILGEDLEDEGQAYEEAENYLHNEVGITSTPFIEMAIYDGWIRFAGGKEANWARDRVNSVSFQCSTNALPNLRNIIKYTLAAEVSNVDIECGHKFFSGNPQDFIRTGFN